MAEIHIKWQDVIEVEENSDPSSRQKVVKALTFIESSKEGQKLFAELQEAQSHIPDGHLWGKQTKIELHNSAIKGLDGIVHPLPDRVTYVTEDDPKRNLRQDPRKVFFSINISDSKADEITLFKRFTGGGGGGNIAGYDQNFHHIAVTFPEVSLLTLPKFSKKGTRKFETAPLEEAIAHEIQHTRDFIRNKFAGGKEFSRECLEQRAVDRENAFLTSAMPLVHNRSAYLDVSLTLKELSKDENFKELLKTEGEATKVFLKIQGGIKMDAGCKVISDDESAKEALKLMKKYHIPTDNIDKELLPKTGEKHSELGNLQPLKVQLSQAKPASDLPSFS